MAATARSPTALAVAITVLGFIGVIGGALALVGRQLVSGLRCALAGGAGGIQQIQAWLADGPLHLTADQIDQYI